MNIFFRIESKIMFSIVTSKSGIFGICRKAFLEN